ncbi:MAG TPA: hypothetical protein IGS37_03160 [Synechococcales cyanobacterium M55_K2018_004]|nr:hypothetical protein [Synechococcales cyanobacterium M55_K2018_004]
MATLIGTSGDDFLVGTSLANLILGEAGDDVLLGEGDSDRIVGGAGNDFINGGAGNDEVDGDDGDDTLLGGEGNDILRGGSGNDFLEGGLGNDVLEGGDGDDFLFGGPGRDILTGGFGNDSFVISNGSGGPRLGNANIITDYVDGQDKILLANGLRFGQLNIFQGTGAQARNTIIQNRLTGEFLAILQGVNRRVINSADFVARTLPRPDTAPPQPGRLFIQNITTSGISEQVFSVQFADAVQLNSRSFRSGNVAVTGPNGFQQLAELVSVDQPGNGTSRTVTYRIIAPNGDWNANNNGTYQVTLLAGQIFDTSGNFARTAALGSFTVNVPIPVVPVSISVSSDQVVEDSGTTMTFTFTREEYLLNALAVSFNLSGSATVNRDFTIAGATFNNGVWTVNFAPNAATATVQITPLADNLREGDESIIVSLVPGAAYRPGSSDIVSAVILDDESDITLTVEPASVLEDSTGAMVYTFTRSGFAERNITVNFAISGTASFGSDYTVSAPTGTLFSFNGTTGSISFAAGESSKTLLISPIADTTFEDNETVALQLSAGVGYAPATTSPVVGTILNDEAAIALSVSPGEVAEDSGTSLVYTFTRTGFTGNPLAVRFTLSGTASPTDYTLSGATISGNSGIISFGPGDTTATVIVTPNADAVLEDNESLTLTLDAGTGYVLGNQTTATGIILNDEGSVSLTVTPESVIENSGTSLVYTFTRSGFIDRAITVIFDVGGTATFGGAGSDYTVTPGPGTTATFGVSGGSVSFAAGETVKTLRIRPIGDINRESDETVSLQLRSNNGYVVTTPDPVIGTFIDDDAAVSLSVNTPAIEEDTGTIIYTFTRAGFLGNALTVRFSVGGTATPGSDYTASSDAANLDFAAGAITFAPGQDTVRLTLTPTRDTNLIEQDETVSLQLLPSTTYEVSTTGAVTSTILNDDGIVRNTADSGAGSLREAIFAALNPLSTSSVITFAPTVSGTINLSSALPVLSRNVTIIGPGSAVLEVRRSSGENFRIFQVSRNATVSLQGLAIANGNASLGGGILNEGTLTLTDTLITGNTATIGGGIHNTGDLLLSNGNDIVNNTATLQGGGIYNNGTLNIAAQDNTLANINVIAGNSAINFTGGGIYNDRTATIINASFSNNRASLDVRNSSGAIYNAASASQLQVGNSFFNRGTLNSPNIIGGPNGIGAIAYTDLGGNEF